MDKVTLSALVMFVLSVVAIIVNPVAVVGALVTGTIALFLPVVFGGLMTVVFGMLLFTR
jgi:hypothetical protein